MSPEQRAESRNRARLRILERLAAEGASDLGSKVASCQREIEFTCTGCGGRKMGKTRCKKKWCPCCAPRIAAEKNFRMQAAVEKFQWPLFVTLTMKNVDDLSFGAVRQLRRAFGKIRHQKWWKKAVKGGVAAIEITNTGNGWHPHLHAVLDCRHLSVNTPEPKPWMSRAQKEKEYAQCAQEVMEKWARALKQPLASIYIKRANRNTILKEVVKYAVKGTDLATCEGHIAPLIRALEATRLLTTFGTVFGLGKVPMPAYVPPEPEPDADGMIDIDVGRNCCQFPALLPSEVVAIQMRPIRCSR